MYIRMCVHICVCVCFLMQRLRTFPFLFADCARNYVQVYTHIQISVCRLCTQLCSSVCKHTHTQISAHAYMRARRSMQLRAHTHTHARTHAHTHTHEATTKVPRKSRDTCSCTKNTKKKYADRCCCGIYFQRKVLVYFLCKLFHGRMIRVRGALHDVVHTRLRCDILQ
jgi:hypothetical protein